MFEGLEIVGITRVGLDYALHFSDGTFGIFSSGDLKEMLGYDVSRLLLNDPKFYPH
jgi:hypothetical protein